MTSDLQILNATVGASTSATEAQKNAARKVAFDLRGEPFVFNAYLCLVARGAPTTESNVKAEAKKIARANERHFASRPPVPADVGEGEPCL